jgi:hypothetical protein
VLLNVDVPIVSDSDCNAAYAGVFDPNPNHVVRWRSSRSVNTHLDFEFLQTKNSRPITRTFFVVFHIRWCRFLPRWLWGPTFHWYRSWCCPARSCFIRSSRRLGFGWLPWCLHPGVILPWLDRYQQVVKRPMISDHYYNPAQFLVLCSVMLFSAIIILHHD